jgi:hypothetical protein
MPGPLSLLPLFADLDWAEVVAVYVITAVLTLSIFALPVLFVWGAHAAWRGARRGEAERRARLHLCAACGYDLRASTGRCPECGEPIPAAEPAELA